MSLSELRLTRTVRYQGLEDHFPDEMKSGVMELVRRLAVNEDALIRDLKNQIYVDGAIVDKTGELATTTEIDQSVVFNMMWEG